MSENDFDPVSGNTEADYLASIAAKTTFCMERYQPYLRNDFNLHHLSLIINLPEKDIEKYFSLSPLTFDDCLNQWRVKHARNLMDHVRSRNLKIKTIGSLSGFSSAKKFTEAFIRFEGISPEDYQSQLNKSSSI